MAFLPRTDYWITSRRLSSGLIFVSPLWLIYEVLAHQLNHGFGGEFRTGLEVLFAATLARVGIPAVVSLGLPAVLAVAYLFSVRKKSFSQLKLRDFGWMFLESLSYGLVFGLCVSELTEPLLTAGGLRFDQTKAAAFVVHLGSGVYEEFFFRAVLLSSVAGFLQWALAARRNWWVYLIAVLLNSLLFAAFHYLKVFGEVMTVESFLFRFMAGVVFSLLFILRGYGVTAYTHTCYNVFLTLR